MSGALVVMAGCGGIDLDDIDGETLEMAIALLVKTARQYQLGGGRWGPESWSAMHKVERAACATAGDHLRREAAVMAGTASRGELAAAEVLAPVDGGDAYLDAIAMGEVAT